MADTSYSFRLTGDMLSLSRGADAARSAVKGLAGQVDGFAARLAAADRATDRFGNFLVGVGARLAVPIAAVAAAGAAVKEFAQRTAGGIDALNDLADATGSSVPNLSALEDIAARTGSSFDAVGASLTKFNNVLKEADGKSGASQVIKALGLDIAALKAEDPAEALRQVAVALSQFADDGNKARAVQELFGRSVREVAPFLADLAKKTELVGTVTTEQARAAEVFSQQLSSLAKDATDLARTLAGPLLDSLNRFKAGVRAYGSVSSYLRDNFRFNAADDIAGNLGRTNQEIAGIEKRLQRITGFEQRAGVGEAVLKRYRDERAELDAQLVTLKQRQAFILSQAPDPSGGPTELARRRGAPVSIGDIVKPEKNKKPGKEPARDALDEADRRIQEALERYVERDIALEEKRTERQREEAAKRLEQAQQFGLQLVDQTEVLSAQLVTDERERGAALIEIDRRRIAEQIEAFQLGTEEQQRLYALLADNVVARNAQLAEQLKPEWQRMLEGWRDTQRLMREAADDFQLSFLRTSEDTWVQFVKSGKLSFDRLADLFIESLARYQFQQGIGQYLGQIGGAIAGAVFGGGSTAAVGGSGTIGAASSSGGSIYALTSGGGRATGGPVGPGSFYKVNERGPELYDSPSGTYLMNPDRGMVRPLQAAAAMGGERPISVSINVIGGEKPEQVKTRQDGNGNVSVDLLYGQFVRRLNEDTAAGYGVAPGVQRRMGGSGAVNLGR